MKHSLLLFVLFAWTLAANAGEIRGRVTNAQGEAIAGARVSVDFVPRKGRGQARHEQAITGPDGNYAITGLEPGRYRVVASLPAGGLSFRRGVGLRSESSSAQADFRFPATSIPPGAAADEHKP